jgi:Family of unknown function (DUF6165)
VLMVPQPYGEVVDRLVILGLKCERIRDEARRAEAARFRDALDERWRALGLGGVEELPEHAPLRAINAELWDVEDALRARERDGRFDDGFVALARRVYRANDERAALKASIDRRLGSPLTEPKQHPTGG